MVDGNLETLGTGDLSFIREGARVVYQRVDDPSLGDAATVIATDYVGRYLSQPDPYR